MENDNKVPEILEKIEGLKKLLDLGVINEAEFQIKKSELIDSYALIKEEDISKSVSNNSKQKKPIKKGVLITIISILVVLAIGIVIFAIPSTGFKCLLLGHHPSNEQIITKVATCNEDGTAVIICDICKKELETVTIQKTNQHSFNNGICTVCGYKDPSSNTFVAFKVRTLVELHIRKGPGLNYDVIRNLPYYSTVTVYETSVADGYTWYRIDKNEWVANDGTWLEYIE